MMSRNVKEFLKDACLSIAGGVVALVLVWVLWDVLGTAAILLEVSP